MNMISKIIYVLLISLFYTSAKAQGATDDISLTDLIAFKNPGKNWVIASDAASDYNKTNNLVAVKGSGAVLNFSSSKNNSHLITNRDFGDLEVELDFMMVKGSNSGVIFKGGMKFSCLTAGEN